MKRKVKKTEACINCHNPLVGENYCPECGQVNDERRPALGSFIAESLGNFFAFDSKFFRTIGYLFWKPGKVALEYVNGKRTAWMKPVRLYFLSSILFLFLGRIDSDPSSNIINIQGDDPKPPKTESAIGQTNEDLEAPEDSLEYNWQDDNGIQKIYSYVETYPKRDIDSSFTEMELKRSWFNEFFFNQVQKAFNMEEKEFSRYFQTKIFWILFLFLPMFSFWLKLVYLRKDFNYLEHLYFAFYAQSAFFLLLSLARLNNLTFKVPMINIATVITFSIYLFLALKNFYKQSIGKTILKFLILNLGFVLFSIIFFLLTVLVVYLAF